MSAPVSVDVDIPEDEQEQENMSRRLRNFTLNRVAEFLTPLANYSHLSSIAWLNSNNEENNSPIPNNLNVRISNQFENNLVSVNIVQDVNPEENENAPNPPPSDNQNETQNNTFPGEDTENNNNVATTVDLNLNEYIPEIIKCFVFVLILLINFLFLHLEGVLTFACLHVIMYIFIGVEQVNLRSKSTWRTFIDCLCILKCLGYIFYYEGLPSTLVIYNPDYKSPKDIWNLLWIIYMNDCAIKFITMGSKLLVKFLPHKILSFRTKLRVYFFFETISQLYRSIVPIQPWVANFSILYQESAYVLSVFLTGSYVSLKIYDVSKKILLLKEATGKLFQGYVNSAPTKEYLATINAKCSVCLDDFKNPVLLSCKHVFCNICITQWATKNKSCPLCRTAMIEDFAPKNISTALYLQLF